MKGFIIVPLLALCRWRHQPFYWPAAGKTACTSVFACRCVRTCPRESRTAGGGSPRSRRGTRLEATGSRWPFVSWTGSEFATPTLSKFVLQLQPRLLRMHFSPPTSTVNTISGDKPAWDPWRRSALPPPTHSFRNCISQCYVAAAAAATGENVFQFSLFVCCFFRNDCYQFLSGEMDILWLHGLTNLFGTEVINPKTYFHTRLGGRVTLFSLQEKMVSSDFRGGKYIFDCFSFI